jgi:hypothetical protein
MASKRQQTMAKMARERTVRERRERKQEKRREKRLAASEGQDVAVEGAESPLEDEAPAPGTED